MTDFSNRAEILAELWMEFRDDEELKDFIEYNDLGLPLAYLVTNKFCDVLTLGEAYINETFDLFLTSLELEDTGFETLDDIFAIKGMG
jgi:hypothetical protein